MTIEFEIQGQPYRTTHQSGTRIGQHGTYKTKQLLDVERWLKASCWPHRPLKPIEGPVKLTVEYAYKTVQKRHHLDWKLTKPDTDNLVKTLKDIMTKCGFWQDDAQVSHEIVEKYWSLEPCIKIRIEEMERKKT